MIEDDLDAEWDALLEEDNSNASDKFQGPQGKHISKFLKAKEGNRTYKAVEIEQSDGDTKTFTFGSAVPFKRHEHHGGHGDLQPCTLQRKSQDIWWFV